MSPDVNSSAGKKINVGVVGATGVVGETFLSLLDEREFPLGQLKLFASDASVGKTRECGGQEWPVETLREGCFDGLNLVFFSSGDDISLEWAPKAVLAGAFAVDNSAAFRMNDAFALCVPEVNGDLLPKSSKPKPDRPTIIANPNCSTIQLVVALQPLAKAFGLEAVRVASYQSVSGAGRNGIEELLSTTRLALEGDDVDTSATFPAPIAFNCVPQIGRIDDEGFCTEETKIMRETCKILRLPKLAISAFTVRVPTLNAHAEAAWVTLRRADLKRADIERTLSEAPGLELMSVDTTAANVQSKPGQRPGYPTQKLASGQDPVYVGRVHRDQADPRTWLMWIVSDNLRKGAALNGIQIAEHIFDLK